MALTVYPTTDWDSYCSLIDAVQYCTEYNVHCESCKTKVPTDEEREVYLRIATQRILTVIDTSLVPTDALPDDLAMACALTAVHDCVYEISSAVNPNTGAISSEKVGDLEVRYTHGRNMSSAPIVGRNTDPFPAMAKTILANYGAVFTNLKQGKLEHS